MTYIIYIILTYNHYSIGTLSSCINQDYEDAEFLSSIVIKFSRKYMEDNIYTKLKSLISIHSIYQKLENDPQNNFMKCIQCYRQEEDSKLKKSYFSSDSLDNNIATNVIELEISSLLKDYYRYLFLYIDTR